MEGRRAITARRRRPSASRAPAAPYGNDCSDAVLLTSRAGSTVYDRTFMETFVRPGLGAGNWVSRTNYPLTGILPAGPDRCRCSSTATTCRTPGISSGCCCAPTASPPSPRRGPAARWSPAPSPSRARQLEINYRTGAPGFVRVEIQDAAGTPIPGYTLEDCPEIIGDEIARVVAWKAGPDVGRLAGQPVRLRFVMKDADLYSIRFGIVREISERNGTSRRFLIDQTGSNTGGYALPLTWHQTLISRTMFTSGE